MIGEELDPRDDIVLNRRSERATKLRIAFLQLLADFLDLLSGRQGRDPLHFGVGERGDRGGASFSLQIKERQTATGPVGGQYFQVGSRQHTVSEHVLHNWSRR